MAAATHGVGYSSTANTTTYTTGSFTPADDDLLVVFVYASSVASGISVSLTSSDGLTFYEAVHDASDVYMFVANEPANAVSQTVTFNCTGDAANGCGIFVCRLSGMEKRGASAVKQTKAGTGTSSVTPSITFDTAPDSGNPILAFVATSSNTSPVITEPSGFAERNEQTWATPDSGIEYATKDSAGPTTVTWGSNASAAWAGIIAELEPESKVAADAGSYSHDGQSATTKSGRKNVASAGSYTHSGQSAALEFGITVAAAAGTYDHTGQVATLSSNFKVAADAGSYSHDGQSAALEFGRTVAAAAGTYDHTGQVATLSSNFKVAADAGSYEHAGTDAALKRGYEAAGEAGSYAHSGASAELSFFASGAFALQADATSYLHSGSTANLDKGSRVSAEAATYLMSGQDSGLLLVKKLAADAGSYTWAGAVANLKYGLSMPAENGAYDHVGALAAIMRDAYLMGDATHYLWDSPDDASLSATLVRKPPVNNERRKPGHWIAERRFNEGGRIPLRK